MRLEVSSNLKIVNELSFGLPEFTHAGASGFITSGPEPSAYLAFGNPNSNQYELQVVELSSREGKLLLGTRLPLDGVYDEDSQMNVYDGVLRVVGSVEQLATFSIVSASEVIPLGQMKLSRNLSFIAYRELTFDKDRAYVLSHDDDARNLVVYLSNPMTPQEVGALPVPGWVKQVEVQGNRLIAMSFEDNWSARAPSVSLYDTSDVTQPMLLGRIELGQKCGKTYPQSARTRQRSCP